MEGSLYVIKENQFLCKDCISTEEHSVSNWISTAPDCVVDTVGHGVGQCSKVGVRKGIPGSPHFCPQLGKSLGRPTLQQLLNPPKGVLHRHQVRACAGGHLAPHPGSLCRSKFHRQRSSEISGDLLQVQQQERRHVDGVK